MSTNATPFMVVYGTEAILPVEVELPSLRISAATKLSPDDEEYVKNRISSLEVLQEEREETQKKLKKYHEKSMWIYNQQVRPRKFKARMLVLCNTREVRSNLPIPKFAPTWEGPYVIKYDVGKGCYDLTSPNGEDLFRVNAKYLKLWRDPIEGGHV